MAGTFEQGKDAVARLCKYFETNQAAFVAPGVKEAHIRQSLIDPLFEALGWDVRNARMVAPQYREVVPEDSLDVEGQQKAPDYTFRVGSVPKFYAEAKKVGVNIRSDVAPAYQLRRYGWSGKVAVSLLTDFEELSVYDCTRRPAPGDKASAARVLYLGYQEYADRWRELWDVFSRDAVWSGGFDQFAASKRKRGTSEVDVEFLREIDEWRDVLARNIALRNKQLSSEQLNSVVQRTIDRIVFLRMAEDRGLEPYEQLLRVTEGEDVYRRFVRGLCQKADDKYNSGLFHFHRETGLSEAADRLALDLVVDDKIFRPILQSLYFTHGSPYHFGALPVEILGTIYERFLGKVIRLTAGHQAKIEEKPEVRKAGGVFYTPAYIVDYIVKETVAKQIAGRSPAQLAGGKGRPPYRILDMACGSGSFLLGAYQHLLDHCLKWYTEHDPYDKKKSIFQDPRTGQWRLTIEEKKRILTTHLFGVDIDAQAVEVSKLSLLLKALEGESDATLSPQLKLFHERALPNLANNIKCGNSLIEPEYFVGRVLPEPSELQRINPFSWADAYPEIIKAGGFDCVIGNPPYVRIQVMKEWAPLEVDLYKELYRAGRAGSYDVYVVFIERGLQLLNSTGRLGFICPHKFFNSKYGEPIRSLIADGHYLSHAVHFGAEQVFDGATTYTCLLFLDKAASKTVRFTQVTSLSEWRTKGVASTGTLDTKKVTRNEWNFCVGPGATLFDRLCAMPQKLGDVADIFVGLQTSADDVYILRLVDENADGYTLYSDALGKEWSFEKELLHPIVSGTDVEAFGTLPTRQYILFPYLVQNEQASLIPFADVMGRYPATAEYLRANKKRLEARERGAFRGAQWHRFGRTQNLGIQGRKKICVPRLVDVLHAAYDSDGSRILDNVDVGGVTWKPAFAGLRLEVILALLNSRLMRWYFPQVSAPFRGQYRSANRQFLSLLPMPFSGGTNHADQELLDSLVQIANNALAIQSTRCAATNKQQKSVLDAQFVAACAEMDRTVYRLYGLSTEEIAIVEGDN